MYDVTIIVQPKYKVKVWYGTLHYLHLLFCKSVCIDSIQKCKFCSKHVSIVSDLELAP